VRTRDWIWNCIPCRWGGTRRDIRSKIEQEFEVATIAGFAAGQVKRQRQATEIDLQGQLRREATERGAKRPLRFAPMRIASRLFRGQVRLYDGQAPHERVAILLSLLGELLAVRVAGK
jgi:hypothetical protein